MQVQIQNNSSSVETLDRKTIEEMAFEVVPEVLLARGIISANDWNNLDIESKKNIVSVSGIDPNEIVERYSISITANRVETPIVNQPFETKQDTVEQKIEPIQPQEAPISTVEVQEKPVDPMLKEFQELKTAFDTTKTEIIDMEAKMGPTPVFPESQADNQPPMIENPAIQAEGQPIQQSVEKTSELSADEKERIAVETAVKANTLSNQAALQPTTQPQMSSDDDIAVPKFFGYQPSADLAKNADTIADTGGMKDAKTWIATLIRKVWLSLK